MAKLKSLKPTPKDKSPIDAELKMREGTKTRTAYVPRTILFTLARDGVCDEVTTRHHQVSGTGACAQGTDCEDCGTCNWYDCVLKEEVPKPKTMYKSESTAGDVLDAGPTDPTPSPAFLFQRT